RPRRPRLDLRLHRRGDHPHLPPRRFARGEGLHAGPAGRQRSAHGDLLAHADHPDAYASAGTPRTPRIVGRTDASQRLHRSQARREVGSADSMNGNEPILQAKGVTIRFGGLTAVSNFEFAIKPHELVGLIGPNGAGKTTVFNMLTGVYKPTEGHIFVGGKD